MSQTPQGHEHEFEPQFGLPEPLPAAERILWQGSPDIRAMAIHVFHIRKVAIYFGLLMAISGISDLSLGGSWASALKSMAWMAVLAGVAVGLLAYLARLSARTTVYTITDRRLVMRVGIVLTLTFNLPFARIASADLRRLDDGIGEICLSLMDNDKIGLVHLWPHARPWHFSRPEPMLRCIRGVDEVVKILTEAWSARVRDRALRAPVADARGHQPSTPITA